jgi:hypothetical protein
LKRPSPRSKGPTDAIRRVLPDDTTCKTPMNLSSPELTRLSRKVKWQSLNSKGYFPAIGKALASTNNNMSRVSLHSAPYKGLGNKISIDDRVEIHKINLTRLSMEIATDLCGNNPHQRESRIRCRQTIVNRLLRPIINVHTDRLSPVPSYICMTTPTPTSKRVGMQAMNRARWVDPVLTQPANIVPLQQWTICYIRQRRGMFSRVQSARFTHSRQATEMSLSGTRTANYVWRQPETLLGLQSERYPYAHPGALMKVC